MSLVSRQIESHGTWLLPVLILSAIFAIFYQARELRRKARFADIRVVFFLFALSVVCTTLTVAWARSIQALNREGTFAGEWGTLLQKLLHFMLDIDTELLLFGALFIIIVTPQIIAYFLSGIVGCAASPSYIDTALTFFIWSVAKSFAVAAGIFVSVAICGYVNFWPTATLAATQILATGFMSLAMAFIYLNMRGDIRRWAKAMVPKQGPLAPLVTRIDMWCTRHSRTEASK